MLPSLVMVCNPTVRPGAGRLSYTAPCCRPTPATAPHSGSARKPAVQGCTATASHVGQQPRQARPGRGAALPTCLWHAVLWKRCNRQKLLKIDRCSTSCSSGCWRGCGIGAPRPAARAPLLRPPAFRSPSKQQQTQRMPSLAEPVLAGLPAALPHGTDAPCCFDLAPRSVGDVS